MNKLIIALAAGSALGAVPAAAQYANVNAGGAVGIQNRITQLDARLRAGLQSGAITRSEAQSLRPQLRQLRQLERQYSANGLTRQERQDLQYRVRSFREQLRYADGGQGNRYSNWNDDDGYNGQNQNTYGQNGGYYGQGTYGQPGGYYGQNQGSYGRNGGYYGQNQGTYGRPGGYYGQNQSTYGRNGGYYGQNQGTYGRPGGYYGQNQGTYGQQGGYYGQNQGSYGQPGGYYGQGGPYEEVEQVCENRGGISGVIGSLLGTNDCLQVGERATRGLGGVPYEYRGQFRDGNGVVYRSDGRNVYQIDARTNTVLRIYSIGR